MTERTQQDIEKLMKQGMAVGQHITSCPECAKLITKHMQESGEMQE